MTSGFTPPSERSRSNRSDSHSDPELGSRPLVPAAATTMVRRPGTSSSSRAVVRTFTSSSIYTLRLFASRGWVVGGAEAALGRSFQRVLWDPKLYTRSTVRTGKSCRVKPGAVRELVRISCLVREFRIGRLRGRRMHGFGLC